VRQEKGEEGKIEEKTEIMSRKRDRKEIGKIQEYRFKTGK
jgi:hypothetical protein